MRYPLLLLAVAAWSSAHAQVASAPPPSAGHSLVYHERLGRVLLLNSGLGSASDSARLHLPSRIWSWDGTRWSVIDSSGPSLRNLAGVAYDRRRNVVVMHGGTASATSRFGETWEWGDRGWVKRTELGPGVRNHVQMAYDAARGRSVLFSGQAEGDTVAYDTWEWDGVQWERVARTGPPPRVHHTMLYDPARQQVIAFGGVQPRRARYGDVWGWDGRTWTELTTVRIPPRTHAQFGIHPTLHIPMVIGGMDAQGLATSMLLLERDTWRSVPLEGPEPRYLPAAVLDERRGVLVLFGGGVTGSGGLRADTWEYDGAIWRRVP